MNLDMFKLTKSQMKIFKDTVIGILFVFLPFIPMLYLSRYTIELFLEKPYGGFEPLVVIIHVILSFAFSTYLFTIKYNYDNINDGES